MIKTFARLKNCCVAYYEDILLWKRPLFTSTVVICPKVARKCCFSLKIFISSYNTSTVTAEKQPKKSFFRNRPVFFPTQKSIPLLCPLSEEVVSEPCRKYKPETVSTGTFLMKLTRFLSCFHVLVKKYLLNFGHFFDHISYQNHWEPPYGLY